jgi:hypothetical protein
MLLLRFVHRLVPLIEELVPEVAIVGQIPLPTMGFEAFAVLHEPFRVAELIA